MLTSSYLLSFNPRGIKDSRWKRKLRKWKSVSHSLELEFLRCSYRFIFSVICQQDRTQAKSNNCKIVTIAQMFIIFFKWSFICRAVVGCLNSLNGGNESENDIWKSSSVQSVLIYSKSLFLQIEFNYPGLKLAWWLGGLKKKTQDISRRKYIGSSINILYKMRFL